MRFLALRGVEVGAVGGVLVVVGTVLLLLGDKEVF